MGERHEIAAGDERSLAELRGAMVRAGLRLGARGLISAAEGNLSVRVSGGRLLITPAGRRKDELEPTDLLVVPLVEDGSATGDAAASPRPSSDVAIHRAILAARPDVHAVAHAHLPASMALTLAGLVPDPAALPETALLLPRLPFIPFAPMGSRELAAAVATALTQLPQPLPNAVLLERHGAIAVGSSIVEAGDRLELVDVLCRVWRDATLLRAAALERRSPESA